MENINKKEIVIKQLNKELKYYKANKRKFNINKYNLEYMRLIIEHLKDYPEYDEIFDEMLKIPNLLLNLVTNIASLEDVDEFIFDEVDEHFFGHVVIEYSDDPDDDFDEDLDDEDYDDEGFIHDNEDC